MEKAFSADVVALIVHHSDAIEGIDSPEPSCSQWSQMLGWDDSPNLADRSNYIANHVECYRYAFRNSERKPVEKDVLDMHRILMKSRLDAKYCGVVRDVDVVVGSHTPPNRFKIKEECSKYFQWVSEMDSTRVWDSHAYFERVHPFVDGNGRMGRVLLNWISWYFGQPSQVVSKNDKWEYYAALDWWVKRHKS